MHTSPAAALRPPRAPRRFLCTPALLQLSDLCEAPGKSVCTRALLQLSSDLPEPQGDSCAHEPCCSSQVSQSPKEIPVHTSPAAALRPPGGHQGDPGGHQGDPGQVVLPAQARNTRNKLWIYSFYSLCLLYLQAWGPHFLSSVRGMCGPHFLLGCTGHQLVSPVRKLRLKEIRV